MTSLSLRLRSSTSIKILRSQARYRFIRDALTTQIGSQPPRTPRFADCDARLSIRRDPSSRLVVVAFSSHDPQLSANVVNTLMKLLVQRNFESRNSAIAESGVWLSRQLDDIREKMERASRALADFGEKHGIADVDPNTNTYSEKMGDLNKQLVQASADRIQYESFLAPSRDPNTLPQVNGSLVIQALTQKLAEAQAQLSQSLVIYGPNHAEPRKLQRQVDELQNAIKAQKQEIVSELRTNYRAAQAREQALSGEVRRATTDLTTLSQYEVLKKEAQADRDLYDALYAKVKEAGISAASKSSNIHIVNRARVLDHPTRPHRAFNILAGSVVRVDWRCGSGICEGSDPGSSAQCRGRSRLDELPYRCRGACDSQRDRKTGAVGRRPIEAGVAG